MKNVITPRIQAVSLASCCMFVNLTFQSVPPQPNTSLHITAQSVEGWYMETVRSLLNKTYDLCSSAAARHWAPPPLGHRRLRALHTELGENLQVNLTCKWFQKQWKAHMRMSFVSCQSFLAAVVINLCLFSTGKVISPVLQPRVATWLCKQTGEKKHLLKWFFYRCIYWLQILMEGRDQLGMLPLHFLKTQEYNKCFDEVQRNCAGGPAHGLFSPAH